MKNLKLYEEFNKSLNEAVTPVYNEDKFRKNINVRPEMELKYSEVIPALKDMLAQKELGQIENITIIAEVPTQGKGAPDYVQDIISKERERLARMHKLNIGKEIDDTEDPEDFDFDMNRFGEKRTIFFDSEFIVDRIENIEGKDYVIGIPVSVKNKGYEAKILPIKIEEIYFESAM